jgi:uncharacterized protein with FMN-binding domain
MAPPRRRAPYVLSATAVGVVAVLSFRTHALSPSTAASGTTTVVSGATPKTKTSTATSSGRSGATTMGSGTVSTSTSTTSLSGTATGTAEETRYGTVQVRVTVSAGRITDVAAVELTATDPHSQQINAEAVPVLRRQVLDTQSAHIDGVSGATFTSDGYEASLQSALDKLGFTR